ncbi:hypothetical protein H3221_004475 [Pseudomonas sp. LMG 31766]|uniref:Uncharacterized protein n=1 Tax=Pseudomonas chaetocerotis TaxID=2758695 RepID=A0A931CYJ3_9PSED|nr:hypothetical protein [Pseudomonas chaetocerotis]MBZ9664005.1 hypothetical protein [Pseudomonas chaetocerotis]
MRTGIVALLVGLPVLLVAGGYAWVRDEPLSADARAWLEQAQVDDRQSRAYVFLNGLDADPGQTPEALGAARLQAYRDWRRSHGPLDEGFAEPRVATLALPQGPLFCAVEKEGCLTTLLSGVSGWVETDEQRLLRERYWEFLQLDDYRNLLEASLIAPLPPHRYLLSGQQLLTLQLLKVAQEGEGEQVRARLDEELHLLRGQLRRADTLIAKMILARMVERNMFWQAVLYRKGLMPVPSSVPAFDDAERSLLMPLQHEFQGMALLFEALPEAENSLGEWLMLRWGLRPQMSTNASLTFYQPAAELSRRSPEVFVGELQQLPAAQWQRSWRNPMGNVLLEIGAPDYRRYAVRLQDLEAYRRLLQGLSQLPQGTPSAEQLRAFDNPYYPGQPAQLDEQGRLCFAGPMLEDDGARCLLL